MKIRPILFSTNMVQALLDDIKNQTRRIIPEKIVDAYYDYDDWCSSVGKPEGIAVSRHYEKDYFFERRKYDVGDIMWVRETWHPTYRSDKFFYRAQHEIEPYAFPPAKWKPNIFMPRTACRLFLEVTNVRVERLQDISKEDAKAEGIEMSNIRTFPDYKNYMVKETALHHEQYSFLNPILSFQSLWQSINGEKSWEENPWVWVYDFKKIEKPENFLTHKK